MTDATHDKILTQHGEKIASLEAGYQQVHRDVTTLSHKFDTLTNNIMSRFDSITAARKPQFGVWAAWASVVVMAIALIATPFVVDLRSVEKELRELKNYQLEQAYDNGIRDEKLRGLENAIRSE